MKETIKHSLIHLVLLLDDALAFVIIFLVLHFLKIKLPLSIIVVMALLFGASIYITHKLVMPVFRKKKITGSEGMVGLNGEVTEPLTPMGVIRVGSEYWKAKSVDEDIEAGEEVEILGVNGLTLMVKLKDQ